MCVHYVDVPLLHSSLTVCVCVCACGAGGDSKWCQEVVRRVNHDLFMAGCYDELLLQRGRVPVYVSTLTKDLTHFPTLVKLEDRAAVTAANRKEAARVRKQLQEEREAAIAAGEAVQQLEHEHTRAHAHAHDQEQEQEHDPEQAPGYYLQSRLSLSAIYLRSICEHANFRLRDVDKSSREVIGVSTHMLEKDDDDTGERREALLQGRHCVAETNERRDDDGVLAGWLESGFNGLI